MATPAPPTSPRIVVGIGADGSRSAVRYATAEARRTGCVLDLVHVLETTEDPQYIDAVETARSTGLSLLHEASRASQSYGVVSNEVLLPAGRVAHDLARAAAGARMLVLEHHHPGNLRRLLTGSTSARAAVHCQVPVVTVPEGWREDSASGVVTVAVQDTTQARALLRVGFEQAREREATLVVLHAWWASASYDVGFMDPETGQRWTARARRELAGPLQSVRADFPEVEVAVDVENRPAKDAVIAAATTSQLLVIGRRHHLLPRFSHLGGVARSTLRHATCPVMIAPEVAATDEERLQLMEEVDHATTSG